MRRTDPDADIRGLLLQAMDREREASADWRPLRPRVLAHLVYEGIGEEVVRLVHSKEGRNPLYVLDSTGRVEAISLCRELARIGRYREAVFIGRTAVEKFMYASRDSLLVHAVDLVRFMDSVPGFEDMDPPQSQYLADLRADDRMQRGFWELYDRQRMPKRRVGYIW